MNTNERKFPGINATIAAIQEESEKNGYFNLYEFAQPPIREVKTLHEYLGDIQLIQYDDAITEAENIGWRFEEEQEQK